MIEPAEVGRPGDRVLVTGAAGFIASHLVDALLARGHEVIAADRRSVHDDVLAAVNLSKAVEHPRLQLHTIELATEDLDQLVAGADTIFHLAAVPGVRSSWGTRFGDYVTSNVVATHSLDLSDVYTWDVGLPELDVLFLEWRWPIPSRNTTWCGAAGHTCDLHRQQQLLDHYTHALHACSRHGHDRVGQGSATPAR
jgi:hypothetical protein